MKAWEITRKDLRILLRDARALFVLLVLPLVFITIIGLTMGKLLGWKNTNQVLKVGVVDAVAYEQIGQAGWDDDDNTDAKPGDGKTSDVNATTATETAKTPGDKSSETGPSRDGDDQRAGRHARRRGKNQAEENRPQHHRQGDQPAAGARRVRDQRNPDGRAGPNRGEQGVGECRPRGRSELLPPESAI